MVIKLVPFWKTVWQYISSAIFFGPRPFLFYSVHYLPLSMVGCQLGPNSPVYLEELNLTFGKGVTCVNMSLLYGSYFNYRQL